MNTSASTASIVPDWPAAASVRAVVTTRCMPGNSRPPYDAMNLGLRSGEDEGVVGANRALLVRALALPSAPCFLRQVHGAQVVRFDRPEPAFGQPGSPPRQALSAAARAGEGAEPGWPAPPHRVPEPEADAAVTRERGVVLAILTADCLPLLLCADDGSEVAAVHAGWRGLASGVIEACVARMDTPAARLLAWLGPAIGPQSYEVGDEVRTAFVDRDAGAAAAFAPTRPGHWFCDLYTLARQRLAAAGVAAVHGGGFDTCADARFYSYRRDGLRSGRFASLIHIS